MADHDRPEHDLVIGNALSPAAARFEALLVAGKDGALLRFALGNEYMKVGAAVEATPHLRRALELDPDYSAAWKLLGKALAEQNQTEDAFNAYQHGIASAQRKGDKQAMKEMQVFARRLAKVLGRE
jgi:predicted Zn-dependent protease